MEKKRSTYGRALTLSLPSGIKVRARRPSVLSLINAGGFPADLNVEVWKLIKKDLLDPDKVAGDPEGIKQWARLIDAYVPHVLIDPRVVDGDAPTDLEEADGFVTGRLNIKDFGDMDKQVAFLFGNGAAPADEELTERGITGPAALAEALRRFRDGSARDEAGRGVEEVRAPALDAAGDRPAVPAGA